MKIKNREHGFTLIELLSITSVLLLVLMVALPGFLVSRDEAKESEVKANLHTIQLALERYATDNDEYPGYLIGGDLDGWTVWHERWDGVNDISMTDGRTASNDRVTDPLLEFDYITGYPANPFVNDGHTVIQRTNVEGSDAYGHGDPRFGYRGDVMGMGLDDPNFFKGAIERGNFTWSEIETRRTLDRGIWNELPRGFYRRITDRYYLFGGMRFSMAPPDSEPLIRYWPGNFFYKASPDTIMQGRHGFTAPIPNVNMVGGPRIRYILGCYGSEGVTGLDVIRLMDSAPDGSPVHWRTPPPFNEDAYYCGYDDFTGGWGGSGGLPEVFGGGDEWTGPGYFYNEGGRNEGEFLYGAPDGVPYGVILVLTDGGSVWEEYSL